MPSTIIAVGTADGQSICDHLARSSAFFVLEIRDGRVQSKTIRERRTDACGSHKSFVEILEGCHTVLCGGIGQGAYDSLTQGGIEPLVVTGKCSVDEAVERYLSGKLATTDERVCLCKHD
jgi:predicted Fe-Mo cluster-binding NifX family protein